MIDSICFKTNQTGAYDNLVSAIVLSLAASHTHALWAVHSLAADATNAMQRMPLYETIHAISLL